MQSLSLLAEEYMRSRGLGSPAPASAPPAAAPATYEAPLAAPVSAPVAPTYDPWMDDEKTVVTFIVDGVPKRYRVMQ